MSGEHERREGKNKRDELISEPSRRKRENSLREKNIDATVWVCNEPTTFYCRIILFRLVFQGSRWLLFSVFFMLVGVSKKDCCLWIRGICPFVTRGSYEYRFFRVEKFPWICYCTVGTVNLCAGFAWKKKFNFLVNYGLENVKISLDAEIILMLGFAKESN